MELQIHHIGNQNGNAMFEVIRSMDMKHTAAVALPDPAKFPVEEHPAKQFLPELRWYLEDYLQIPYGVFPQLAECVEKTMQAWGASIFDALFTGYAQDWYQNAKRQNFDGFRIKITSDSPEILSWPWETLYSGDDGWLALRCCIDRQLSNIGDPPPLQVAPAQDSIHILYVIPRPYGENDVSYNVLANSLMGYIKKSSLPVAVDILRPPTFDQLRKVLYEHPGYYHIVHFDGHGGYGEVMDKPAENLYAAPEGRLVFESENGEPDPIDTRLLAQLLAEYNIPFMVMNACQSGMIDGQAQDPFASVAAGLLRAGVRSVVAMGYSLYVSGAKTFIPAFYERLFSTGVVSEAVRAGRGKMLQQPKRDCIVGQLPLQDWVVPVLYQQMSSESVVLPKIRTAERSDEEALSIPEDARVDGDYGFIGRGRDIQRLERAMIRQPQAAILIHGQAGVGKTSLAKGFLHWLSQSGGLRREVFWFNFQEIHSAEYVINRVLDQLADTSALAWPAEEKQKNLTRLLRDKPCLLVWDNFESASGIEGTEIQPQLSTEDREILARLLKELRTGKTKVLITSRSEEAWLSIPICYRLPLGGLTGEDLWEYCNAVVGDLGLTLDRSNETYVKILDKLCGNPLAIRSILLRLRNSSAEQLLVDLESNFEGMEGDESTRRLQAAYAVFGSSLTEKYLPVLRMTGLHEFHAKADCVKSMLDTVGCPVEVDMVNACYHILENAGFCTHIGQNVYQLHPVLRGYLLRQMPASEPMQRAFVNIMGSLANALNGKPLYQVNATYQINIVNFYYARQLAKAQNRDIDYIVLTQSLAYHAEEMRCFAEAKKLYLALAEKAEFSKNGEAASNAYYQLGKIALEQRDFAVAEDWFKKSLTIKEKQGNEHDAALIYHALGIIAEEQRDFAVAEAQFKKSLTIEEKQDNDYGPALTYYELGIIAQEQRDFVAAEAWLQKALVIFEKQGNDQDVARIYYALGMIARKQRDFIVAENWYKKALVIEEKQGNEYDAASIYHALGMIAEEQRDFAGAENWYKKALMIFEKQGNEYSAAITYHHLGCITQEQRDYATAEAWLQKALVIFEKKDSEYDKAIVYHELGIIAQKQRDLQGAEVWYKKALAIKEKQHDEHSAASTYYQLGTIAEEQRDFMVAEAWYKKALTIFKKLNNKHDAACIYYQLGTMAEERRIFLQAGNFYLRSIKMFVDTNDTYNVMFAICGYARLLHATVGTEHSQLRRAWETSIPEELTKILEEMEGELNDENS
ncbi:MAG: tetratricopeptide repeat protein [Lachnospiraceae bacterium]|nr:tetratricopeptide repeat protein [Lachnospiraceae bacterium]